MEYSVGSVGRVVVIRLSEGDELYECIEGVAKKESITSAAVFITGGMRKADVVVGTGSGERTDPCSGRTIEQVHRTRIRAARIVKRRRDHHVARAQRQHRVAELIAGVRGWIDELRKRGGQRPAGFKAFDGQMPRAPRRLTISSFALSTV